LVIVVGGPSGIVIPGATSMLGWITVSLGGGGTVDDGGGGGGGAGSRDTWTSGPGGAGGRGEVWIIAIG